MGKLLRRKEHYVPKEVPMSYSTRGRKLIEIYVKAKSFGKSCTVEAVASIISQANADIISMAYTQTKESENLLLFVDFTNSYRSAVEVLEDIKRQPFTIDAKIHSRAVENTIIEGFGFPVTCSHYGGRLLIIPADSLREFFSFLNLTFGTGGEAITYNLGHELGRHIYRNYCMGRNLPKDKCLNVFFEILRVMGLGIYEVYDLDLKAGRGRVIVRDNFEAEDSKARGCHFTKGLIAGVFEEATELPVNVVEHKCKARGYPYCEFIIRRIG